MEGIHKCGLILFAIANLLTYAAEDAIPPFLCLISTVDQYWIAESFTKVSPAAWKYPTWYSLHAKVASGILNLLGYVFGVWEALHRA